jgi:pimeloyl-ACP methyl ester carboxylesterase
MTGSNSWHPYQRLRFNRRFLLRYLTTYADDLRYWGILRSYGTQPGVQVLGDTVAFANHSRVWRLFLEEIRTVVNRRRENREQAPASDEDEEDDAIFGRYVRTDTPLWGKSRVFCEYAGSGPQHLLFLHTAGSDSRQYHALMNDRHLQQRCTMYAFDLPGHGRSDLGTKQQIGNLKCDEESYVDIIKQIIQRLKLQRPIICGASMAGQVCLAVALRASELGVSGVIPCEACEHLSRYPAIYGYSDVAESILNPESVCGMMSPTAPAANKRLVWWSYSSQGTGVFKGDLTFYFQGWDGRGRMGQIDTKACPVYMLTGEYDYSCSPATSKATADQIPGAVFETMEGLGHFPATEDPTQFLPYLNKAIDHIQASRKGEQAE